MPSAHFLWVRLAKRYIRFCLNCSRHGKSCKAGGCGYNAGCGVCHVGCGGNGNRTGESRKDTCGFVIGIARALCEGSAVEVDCYSREGGGEGVAQNEIVGCNHRCVAGVLNNEGIGYLTGAGDRLGAYRLGNGEDSLVTCADSSHRGLHLAAVNGCRIDNG